ncbi:hypothetical protein NDU88_004311 [Pleurodeles waltl]|uniref:Uncharacterized protein n=1 Tax=Pleurodeles waltl TaxID=8319 RepID=A0AAV7WRY3_PLEWA|nr:hypothetical protein NDU88_004311 [Pleurodeles waltl]
MPPRSPVGTSHQFKGIQERPAPPQGPSRDPAHLIPFTGRGASAGSLSRSAGTAPRPSSPGSQQSRAPPPGPGREDRLLLPPHPKGRVQSASSTRAPGSYPGPQGTTAPPPCAEQARTEDRQPISARPRLLRLGPHRKQKNTEGFNGNDKENQKLLDEKPEDPRSLQQHIITAFKKAAYSSIKSKVQAKFREMQESWLKREADEILGYADSYKSNSFYDPLRSIYGPQSSGPTSLFSADWSTMLTNRNYMLTTRAEHFNTILDGSFSISAEAFDRTPEIAINTSLAEPPKESEDKKAIKLLSND